jgi:hypothetical protein
VPFGDTILGKKAAPRTDAVEANSRALTQKWMALWLGNKGPPAE